MGLSVLFYFSVCIYQICFRRQATYPDNNKEPTVILPTYLQDHKPTTKNVPGLRTLTTHSIPTPSNALHCIAPIPKHGSSNNRLRIETIQLTNTAGYMAALRVVVTNNPPPPPCRSLANDRLVNLARPYIFFLSPVSLLQ